MAPTEEVSQMQQPTTPATEEVQPATTATEEVPPATIASVEVEQSVLQAAKRAVSLANNGDVDRAIDIIRTECSQAPAAALSNAYQAILEAQLRMDRSEAAVTFLTELQQAGRCVLPAGCQESVLRALVQTQQHARASELLRSMCAAGAAPGDAVFNSVVDAAVRARAYGEAWDVLELLLSHERRADKYFVSILTKSLESSNDRKWVRRGISLVDRFVEQQKDDVDEIVFNSLLNVLGHVGDMLKLQHTLNRMTEYNVPPSAVTYGTVVKAYGRARDIDAVLKVWQDMRNRCLGVNPVTCGCVLDACVKCGHLDKAMAIFQEMRLQGLHKNTVLYATLIKGLAKVRDLMGALHLYQEMRTEGVPCNLVTFNSLMDVCVRCGNLPMAAVFLQDMIAMGIQPDLITFSTLIKGYAHTGEVHKALALSKELKSRGLKCDEIMYNSLIDGCAKANKLPEGLLVFDDMLQSYVAPSNITFSILVKLYFEAGQIMDAFRIVDEMAPKYRCVPSRIVYTVLLRCAGQQGGTALARGAALLTELASKRNSKLPDQGMVSAVVAGCIQHLEFDLALRVVHEFAAGGQAKRGSSGLVPLDSLRSLLEAFGAHDEPRGQELLESLRRRSLPIAQISQLQAALVDGRRQAASGQVTAGNAATTALAAGQQDAHLYAQWQNANPYGYQPYVESADYYQQYNNIAYQQQMAQWPQQQMSQMGYYGAYQQPQMQMPMYPSMPTPTAQMQQMMQAQQMPAMPQMPAMLQMPFMQGPVPPVLGSAQPPAGSDFLVAPIPEVQAPAAVVPGLLPAAPTPPATVATATASPTPAAAPAPTTPAPAPAPKAEKKASSRRTSADKENAAPPTQRNKGGLNEIQKENHGNIMQNPNLRQAI
jgi:pentatricopeptide repeat protein